MLQAVTFRTPKADEDSPFRDERHAGPQWQARACDVRYTIAAFGAVAVALLFLPFPPVRRSWSEA